MLPDVLPPEGLIQPAGASLKMQPTSAETTANIY